MIFHDYKLIFIHIPKTGGSSVEHALAGSLGMNLDVTESDENIFTGWDEKNHIWRQHATIEELTNLYQGSLEGYTSVSFVRNVWSRAVSDFLWLSQDLKISDGEFVQYLTGSGKFEEALDVDNKQPSRRYDHVRSQSDFITVDDDLCVDYVGGFETILQDFEVLCEMIGVSDIELPHLKKSKYDKPYIDYYDEETIALVAEKYKKDISIFKHEFGK